MQKLDMVLGGALKWSQGYFFKRSGAEVTSEIWRAVLGVGEGEGWSEQAWFFLTGSQQVGDTGHLYFPP